MPVQVITDSTADLPPEVAQSLGIVVVPLNVHFGTETFLDGVTITPDAFYTRLQRERQLPKTTQPSIGTFMEVYTRHANPAGILSLHISSKISGTYNSAMQAAQEIKDRCPIEVVDTLQVSLALGLVVLAAARAVQAGASLPQAAQLARQTASRCHLFGVLDTLEYLEKGGRIGKAAAFLGSVLQVKPILTLKDGEAHPLERVRTRRRAIERVVEITRQYAPLAQLAVVHSTTPDEAQDLAERLKPLAPPQGILMGRFGAVLGTYLGPGALGVALERAG
ncbi:MAG: DegV family protein [Dehalococcoidia bacterium]|nr:DegV family protein [Dehalococcoidia bacterium]MDW8119649.1 DegV family protein [Chloroflexota bacterium]